MRLASAIETMEPCPACKGTGHSGNLHDETCAECDGGRRRWVTYQEDPVAYMAASGDADAQKEMLKRPVAYEPQPIPQGAEFLYELPEDAVPGQVWPRTRVVPATAEVDPKLPPRKFIDTDKEWP